MEKMLGGLSQIITKPSSWRLEPEAKDSADVRTFLVDFPPDGRLGLTLVRREAGVRCPTVGFMLPTSPFANFLSAGDELLEIAGVSLLGAEEVLQTVELLAPSVVVRARTPSSDEVALAASQAPPRRRPPHFDLDLHWESVSGQVHVSVSEQILTAGALRVALHQSGMNVAGALEHAVELLAPARREQMEKAAASRIATRLLRRYDMLVG